MKQSFFPQTNTPLFYVDYRLPEGSDIHATLSDVIDLEGLILEYEGVEAITSFVGRGATRFTTIMKPEQPNSAYAQLVVRVRELSEMDKLMALIDSQLLSQRPDAQFGYLAQSSLRAVHRSLRRDFLDRITMSSESLDSKR